jgi:putative copper export protein/mono/diheme cytochrome c family protein
MEWAGGALRWLQLTGGLVLLGSLVLLGLAGAARGAEALRWRREILAALPWLAGLCLLTAIGLLALKVVSVTDSPGAASEASEWLRLLRGTRFGAVWLARQALMLALLCLALASPRQPFVRRSVEHGLLALAVLHGLVSVFTGHGAATDPVWLAAGGQAVHWLAAALWVGALPALAWGLYRAAHSRDPEFRAGMAGLLRRFSRWATACLLLVVASGLLIAYLQLGAPTRWPARVGDVFGGIATVLERSIGPLLGTAFGQQVLAKLALLVVVLVVAARVRWVWMPRLGSCLVQDTAAWRAASRSVWVELGIVLAILGVAASLASTLPAAHDQVVWPLPYRFSPAATWEQPGVQQTVMLVAAACLLGLVWLVPALMATRRGEPRRQGRLARVAPIVAGVVSVTSLVVGLAALSVEANPDTYVRTDVGYNALSVARGVALYSQHCVSCHGAGGKGDGPLAAKLTPPPADLTASHTAQHTAGDLYRWLSLGKPRSAMPGFSESMTPEQRWDVVNFLRAFSAGFQARILTPRVVPGQPWLAAPDFDFTTPSGTASSLKEYRQRQVVLLVFYSMPSSEPRLRELAALHAQLQAQGAEVLLVPLQADEPPPPRLPLTVALDGARDARTAYLLFRRTLGDAGTTVLGDAPAHMEFLFDRFGYLRARWLPRDETNAAIGWSDPRRLLDELAGMNREPQLLPPPDEHVH